MNLIQLNSGLVIPYESLVLLSPKFNLFLATDLVFNLSPVEGIEPNIYFQRRYIAEIEWTVEFNRAGKIIEAIAGVESNHTIGSKQYPLIDYLKSKNCDNLKADEVERATAIINRIISDARLVLQLNSKAGEPNIPSNVDFDSDTGPVPTVEEIRSKIDLRSRNLVNLITEYELISSIPTPIPGFESNDLIDFQDKLKSKKINYYGLHALVDPPIKHMNK